MKLKTDHWIFVIHSKIKNDNDSDDNDDDEEKIERMMHSDLLLRFNFSIDRHRYSCWNRGFLQFLNKKKYR